MKSAHMSIQVQREHSGLRNGSTTYTCSPWRPGFLVTIIRVVREHHRELDANPGASGPHAFAVRRPAHRHAQPTSTATCPDVSDDGRRPLFSEQGKPDMPQTRIAEKQNISFRGSGQRGQITDAMKGFCAPDTSFVGANGGLRRKTPNSPYDL